MNLGKCYINSLRTAHWMCWEHRYLRSVVVSILKIQDENDFIMAN